MPNPISKSEERLMLVRKKMAYISKFNGVMIIQYDVKRDIFIRLDDIGENPEHDIPLDKWRKLVYPKDKTITEKLLSVLQKHEVDQYTTEYRYKFPTNYTWFKVTATAYERDSEGLILNYICLVQDINERKKETDKIQRLREKAEAANHMKTLFIEHLSHEIRTPLNSILGFSDLITNKITDEECNIFKNLIASNTQMLLNIVNDSINLSLIEAGFVTTKNEWFDFTAFFSYLHQSLSILINKNLEFNCLYNDHILIYSDKTLIHEILNVFIMNANKFTPSGSITMSYQTEKDGIRISVTDTGIGIKKQDQQRIFNRFEKLDPFTQGLGLGLTLCHSISKKIHGRIGVKSELGKGSTFWLRIPCETQLETE